MASSSLLSRDGLLRLDLGVRLQDQVTYPVLRRGIHHRPKKRETPAFAVHRVLARRERDVPAVSTSPLPDGKANQLEPVERAAREVQFGVGQLAGRVALVVHHDFYFHGAFLLTLRAHRRTFDPRELQKPCRRWRVSCCRRKSLKARGLSAVVPLPGVACGVRMVETVNRGWRRSRG